MKIIKSTDPIDVAHPVFVIFGQPGIGKTSLGYSAANPLLLDADAGAHRAVNRRDTLQVKAWSDVLELSNSADALAPYQTLVGDTVGRCLDLMALDIMDKNPKYSRDGALTLQGFGQLKANFGTWMTRLRSLEKDVVLLAHGKEEKDGDTLIIRPDITGGSYHEVMKIADFVGFLYMRGRDRVLDFSPTDRWVGKNPANWKPLVVPPADKAQDFLAGLIKQGREALGAISGESAKLAAEVDSWRQAIAAYDSPAELNAAIPQTNKLAPMVAGQVKRILMDRSKELKFTFDQKTKKFVAPKKAEPEPEAELVGAAAGNVDPELGF